MKEVTKFVAYDGKEFDLKSECEAYENIGVKNRIKALHIRMQQYKSGEMAEVHKAYVRAKAFYIQACTTKMPTKSRAEIIQRYCARKEVYEKTVNQFERIKREYNRLVEALKKSDAVQ